MTHIGSPVDSFMRPMRGAMEACSLNAGMMMAALVRLVAGVSVSWSGIYFLRLATSRSMTEEGDTVPGFIATGKDRCPMWSLLQGGLARADGMQGQFSVERRNGFQLML